MKRRETEPAESGIWGCLLTLGGTLNGELNEDGQDLASDMRAWIFREV